MLVARDGENEEERKNKCSLRFLYPVPERRAFLITRSVQLLYPVVNSHFSATVSSHVHFEYSLFFLMWHLSADSFEGAPTQWSLYLSPVLHLTVAPFPGVIPEQTFFLVPFCKLTANCEQKQNIGWHCVILLQVMCLTGIFYFEKPCSVLTPHNSLVVR